MFINGLNLGRYWSIGPQQSLYLPGPYLNSGTNQVQTRVNHHFDTFGGTTLPKEKQICLCDQYFSFSCLKSAKTK